MKKIIIFIILIFLIGVGFYIYTSFTNKNNDSNYSSNYTAQKTTSNLENQNSNNDKVEVISSFSTTLPKDTNERYSNINLACKTIDGTIVKSGDTFSLWDTLGCPTAEKGYKKAKAFTSDGKIKKSYGGGICQVSTTIYNAVLEIDDIKILERHEHSRKVVYIKDGKDAAVSYNSADLKFKNDLEYDIRLNSKLKNNKVKIKIEKVN